MEHAETYPGPALVAIVVQRTSPGDSRGHEGSHRGGGIAGGGKAGDGRDGPANALLSIGKDTLD